MVLDVFKNLYICSLYSRKRNKISSGCLACSLVFVVQQRNCIFKLPNSDSAAVPSKCIHRIKQKHFLYLLSDHYTWNGEVLQTSNCADNVVANRSSFQRQGALLVGRDFALMEMEQKKGTISACLFLVAQVQGAFMAHLLLFVFAFLVSFGNETRGSTVEMLHKCC